MESGRLSRRYRPDHLRKQTWWSFSGTWKPLYPRLQEYGLVLMINDPALYQGVWYEYHVTALKNLRRHIRAETFVVKDWNEICTRINEWLKKQSR